MLKFNSFRAQRYLRSKFVEGKYLLASEGTDIELEMIDLLRRVVKETIGDVAVADAWQVQKLSATQLLVKPGEAWFKGLPLDARFGKDQTVSGAILTAGIVPVGVTLTDDASGLGKVITFNNAASTPTNLYRIVISVKEQLITEIDDPFLQNANLSESTGQKIRLLFQLNVVPDSLQTESPIPYTDENSSSLSVTNFPNAGGMASPNLVNQISVTPTSGGNGELIAINPISGSEKIDGRDLELVLTNNDSLGGGHPIPKSPTEQQAFSNGKLIDSNGSIYHVNAVFNDIVSTQVVIRIDKEVGQPNPEIVNTKPFILQKRDVFVTDDVNGQPQGKQYWPIAKVNFSNANGIIHETSVTDLRTVVQKLGDYQFDANNRFDVQLINNGAMSYNSSTQLLTWASTLSLINPSGPLQTIAANSIPLLDGSSLAYLMNLSGGSIAKGNLAINVTAFGATSSLSSVNLSSVLLGNLVKDSAGVIAAITAVDDVNNTITTSPSLSANGAATIYLDTYASGKAPLSEKTFVAAIRSGNVVSINSFPNSIGKTPKLVGGGTLSVAATGGSPVSIATNLASGGGGLGIMSATNEFQAQTFQASSAGTLDQVTFRMVKNVSGTVSGNMVVKVYSDSAGQPGTLLGTSNPINASVLTTSAVDTTFTFTSGPSLATSTTYWAVLDTSSVTFSGGGEVIIKQNNSNSYAFGSNYLSTDSGATYFLIGANYDLIFEVDIAGAGGPPQLSFTSSMFLEMSGLAYSDNTITTGQSPISFSADLKVAYVIPNTGSGGPNLTVIVDDLVNVPSNAMIIARREGSDVIVGTSSTRLKIGQSSNLYSQMSDQNLAALGLSDTSISSVTLSSNIRGTSGESFAARLGKLTDAAGDEQEDRSAYLRSLDPITWTGTQLQFTSDIILEILNTKSGTLSQHTILVAGSPITINNGESVYFSISRSSNSETVTAIRSSITPIPAQTQANKDIYVLARRVDSGTTAYLHLPFHKQVMNPGQSAVLGLSGGGSGTVKATFYDPISTSLPTGASVTIDGIAGANGDLVLYGNLSSGNNQIYKLGGVGTSITWTAVAAFNGQPSPLAADSVRFTKGNAFSEQLAIFDGTNFKVNDVVRYFDGVSGNFWEQSSIKSSSISNNTSANLFTVIAAGSENMIISYSIVRGGTKETGQVYLTTDGTLVRLAQGDAYTVRAGVTFTGSISTGNLLFGYTSDNSGPSGSIKYFVSRWSDSPGGPTGIPSYSGGGGGGGSAGGAPTQIQFNNAGALDGDSRLQWKSSNGSVVMGTLEYQVLSSGITLNDNTASPTAFITYDAATYRFSIIDYSVVRNGIYRVGTMLVTNDGTLVSFDDAFTETVASGLTFSGSISGSNVNINYVSSNTGFNATFKYSVRKWN